MRSAERRRIILELLHSSGQVEFSQIKERMPDISDITIRRELEAMDREKLLVRIRGGAKSFESIIGDWEDSYPNRMREHAEEKKQIAAKAVGLIEPHASVFLDSGSTAMCLAGVMPDTELELFTTGLTCALELSRLRVARVQMLGGTINKNSYSVNGDVSVAQVYPLHFQLAFLGATGYIPGRGFITTVADDYVLKHTIVQNSQKVVMILDSSKEGKDGTYTFAEPGEVDVVVSDGGFSALAQREFERCGILLL